MIKNLPPQIRLYGNPEYRNKQCPKEAAEQATFVSRIRSQYPDTYGKVIVHIKNEGLRKKGQISSVYKDIALGLTKGASDIIIPGSPSFVCELKRMDASLCKITQEQIDYLVAAHAVGAFACVALGCDAASKAFEDYLSFLIKSVDYQNNVRIIGIIN